MARLDRERIPYLSHSKVAEFERCPRCYYRQYVLGQREESEAMRLGGLFHAAARRLYTARSLGLFLGETRRLHPVICRFVSDLVYDGRLQAIAGNENRRIVLSKSGKLITTDAGIGFSSLEHEGNTQASAEEVDRVLAITKELVGRPKIGPDGKPNGKITINDILFVAPYNMQVRRLREALPAGARVGSVDKFQGQEAEIVIMSMCSSFGEYGSRGIEFILDRNRMNVALSRARTLAIVVGDPRIATTPAYSIDTMRRINLYCRLIREHGE